MSDDPDLRRAVLRNSLGVGLAVGTYGMTFGALAVTTGLNLWQTVALSLLTFTGGSQFAFVSVVGGGGSAVAAVATATLLGTRNALYGLRLAPMLDVKGWRRAAAAHLTIDESTAMALAQPTNAAARIGFWTTGVAIFISWNVATLVGAVAVDWLGDPARFGLDAAVPAALLALIWPQLKQRRATATAVGAALLALALTPLLPAGIPVLLASTVAIVLAWPEPKPEPTLGSS